MATITPLVKVWSEMTRVSSAVPPEYALAQG